MSRHRTDKTVQTRRGPDESKPSAPLSTPEISAYVADLVKGVRHITRGSAHRDIGFLDFLLALAEQEAENLATNVYH